MLIEINYRNRRKTIYKCDRCNRETYAFENHAIYEKNQRGSIVRAYDLCKHCYRFWKAFMRKQV